MSLLRTPMESIVKRLQALLPSVRFIPGESLHWSPEKQVVSYRPSDSEEDIWGLLHEAGHARLVHAEYASDMELLQLEVAAWDEAGRIATLCQLEIDEEHVQDCLDTYR